MSLQSNRFNGSKRFSFSFIIRKGNDTGRFCLHDR